MGTRRETADRRRAQEFESFTVGAAGRLLHVAALLTGEARGSCPAAERLLVAALAHTYAAWDGLRGEDPYDHARTELTARFARSAWRYRRARGGVLGRLGPRERLVLVLRLHEDVDEERAAATLGLPPELVREVYTHALSEMRSRTAEPHGSAGPLRLVPR
ncbi:MULTISPECIES: sigma factor-like helix-turn-helix DNA-binding protein [unclassified Streptomyces]|uniref:sigma factor-like helix-turn-helix DNA-binding protein n=1 Tax=unclassified Streptomyces TaxID=2593676 RepID=UPI0022B72FE2|nr:MULTISPECIES: sigma factor-like helix-turn-helix DNA-binding protein [unclassified Streptomyces]MCZ7416857.1 sigma factor-like helix-turn-helix DNA-binding protein [Streptomyces sp. WMMC897]MCZ7433326.1 sigma factor-like helix-turn-helix DNA-binding protein [Streptomyces sp. WMMC1477]